MKLVDWSKPLELNGGHTYCRAHQQWEASVAGGWHSPVLFQFWRPSVVPFRDVDPLGPMPAATSPGSLPPARVPKEDDRADDA